MESEEKPPPSLRGEPVKEKPPWFGKRTRDSIWLIEGKIESPFGPRGNAFTRGSDIGFASYQEVRAAMDGEVILARDSTPATGMSSWSGMTLALPRSLAI